MKARLVLAVVLVVSAVLLWWAAGRAVPPVSRGEDPPSARLASEPSAPSSPGATWSRDPFRFAEAGPATTRARPNPTLAPAPPSPDPPPPVRVRLMGLVRRAGVLRAALVVDGQVLLASAGETVGGFLVVSLDEEGGVRLRDPAGLESTLALPEEP